MNSRHRPWRPGPSPLPRRCGGERGACLRRPQQRRKTAPVVQSANSAGRRSRDRTALALPFRGRQVENRDCRTIDGAVQAAGSLGATRQRLSQPAPPTLGQVLPARGRWPSSRRRDIKGPSCLSGGRSRARQARPRGVGTDVLLRARRRPLGHIDTCGLYIGGVVRLLLSHKGIGASGRSVETRWAVPTPWVAPNANRAVYHGHHCESSKRPLRWRGPRE